MKNFFLVKEDFVNARFDRWFKKNICNIPQSLIEKHIRKGNFKVNNKKKKSSYKVQLNDQITINNLSFLPKKQDKIIYKATKKELHFSIYPGKSSKLKFYYYTHKRKMKERMFIYNKEKNNIDDMQIQALKDILY